MLNYYQTRNREQRGNFKSRRGLVIVLAAILMVAMMGFTALVVDFGFISLIRNEMQTAADASALAAGMELADGYGPGAVRTQSAMMTKAQSAGAAIAAANPMADRGHAYLNSTRDLEFGKQVWNPSTQQWDFQSGVGPYTAVRTTIRRDQVAQNANDAPALDGQLSLFFARVIGNKTASCRTKAVAALKPGDGVKVTTGSSATAEVLPIALDQQTWTNLLAGTGSDDYSYDPATGIVSSGADGIKEVNIYPTGSANLPPGNRGTVDFGSSNNSTADLSRQIRYGLNASDLSYFPNHEIRFDNGPMIINGDTGISAGIKDDLAAIIGKPRAMPLFTSVSGPGNNAMYTIVKLVGVRIVSVKLTGSPSQKEVIVQPATFVSRQVITSTNQQVLPDSIFAPVRLVQ
ncbi:MAG: hypothetical protein JWN70_1623 [Planctomycetaceae bacterium]|nr:hypothetical protein [Planctomycetaceae bacterium]